MNTVEWQKKVVLTPVKPRAFRRIQDGWFVDSEGSGHNSLHAAMFAMAYGAVIFCRANMRS